MKKAGTGNNEYALLICSIDLLEALTLILKPEDAMKTSAGIIKNLSKITPLKLCLNIS